MRPQDYIYEKKKQIIGAFCTLYGEEYLDYFSRVFDELIFLYPHINQEDYDYIWKLFYRNEMNYNALPQTLILEMLEASLGSFRPILMKDSGDLKIRKLVICGLDRIDHPNMDIVLLHELKHAFTYHYKLYVHDQMLLGLSEKCGVNIVHKNYFYGKSNVKWNRFSSVNEVLTQKDARLCELELKQQGGIFPVRENAKTAKKPWSDRYISLFQEVPDDGCQMLRDAEMKDTIGIYTDPVNEVFLTKLFQVMTEYKESMAKGDKAMERQLCKRFATVVKEAAKKQKTRIKRLETS